MKACKPIAVPKGSFIFCKYGVALIVWAGLLLQLKWLLVVSFVILALSALLKIERAPMIFIYTHTIDRFFPSPKEIVDEHALCFAHTFGATLNLVGLLFLYFGYAPVGWGFILVLALAKISGALGYCGAAKLYGCMNSDTCCQFMKKRREHSDGS